MTRQPPPAPKWSILMQIVFALLLIAAAILGALLVIKGIAFLMRGAL